MTPAEAFGARVIALRRERRMSRAELSRRIGIPSDRLVRWEKGQHDPQLASIVRVAVGLGVTVADLVATVEAK